VDSREGDGGETGERDGRGVAEDAGAGFGLVFVGDEFGDWSAGKQEVVGVGEEVGGLLLEEKLAGLIVGVAGVESGLFCGGGGSGGGHTGGDGGLEVVEIAVVDNGGFVGLDVGEDFYGVGPVSGVELGEGCAEAFEECGPGGHGAQDVGVAVVEEAAGWESDAEGGEVGRGSDGEIEQCMGEDGAVAEVAVEPAEGVECGREVGPAGPEGCAGGDGGSEAGEAAESGGDADGAARVGADGREGGAFLYRRCCAAGGASGEECGVAGLEAVVEVAVFSGDAVGELVEVGLASDEGSSLLEASRHGGVLRGEAVVVAVERGTAGGREAGEVEAVFERDGDAPESLRCDVVAVERVGLRAGPGGVLREVDVVAGIGVGVG